MSSMQTSRESLKRLLILVGFVWTKKKFTANQACFAPQNLHNMLSMQPLKRLAFNSQTSTCKPKLEGITAYSAHTTLHLTTQRSNRLPVTLPCRFFGCCWHIKHEIWHASPWTGAIRPQGTVWGFLHWCNHSLGGKTFLLDLRQALLPHLNRIINSSVLQ